MIDRGGGVFGGLREAALPPAMQVNYPSLTQLSQVYTQIEAAVGEFGLDTLTASTRALASDSPGRHHLHGHRERPDPARRARDALAAQMQAVLMGAEFGGLPTDQGTLDGTDGTSARLAVDEAERGTPGREGRGPGARGRPRSAASTGQT